MIFANLIFQTTNTSYGKVHRKKLYFYQPGSCHDSVQHFLACICAFLEFSVITSTSSLFMAIWGLPFVGVGIYLLFGRFIQSICLRNKNLLYHHQQKADHPLRQQNQALSGRGYSSDGHSSPQNGNGTILFWQESVPQKWKEILLPILRWKILQM